MFMRIRESIERWLGAVQAERQDQIFLVREAHIRMLALPAPALVFSNQRFWT